jgi:site-specific recombinase XerD
MYNRDLKKLEPYTNTIIRLTSHTPRHTYTNLLLSNNTDVYSISKSLGHSKLSITESYLNDFDINKIDSDNTELFRMINLNKLSLKD